MRISEGFLSIALLGASLLLLFLVASEREESGAAAPTRAVHEALEDEEPTPPPTHAPPRVVRVTLSEEVRRVVESRDELRSLVRQRGAAGDTVVARLMRKVAQRGVFRMVFSGTSVTAAHDNLLKEAYPARLCALLKPSFRAAGVRLECHNVAMGGNPILPYGHCINSVAGLDADVLGWEQEMMAPDKPHVAMELFMRRSFAMPSRPSVLFLSSVSGNDIDVETFGTRFLSDGLRQRYGQSTAAPGSFAFACAMGKFSAVTHEWALKDKCCGKADWHPGTNGHELIASALALHYERLLIEALQRLESGEEPPATSQAIPHSLTSLAEENDGFDDSRAAVPNITCWTTFAPIRMDRDLLKVVLNARVVVDLRPALKPPMPRRGKWTLGLLHSNIKPVQRVRDAGALYLDYKWALGGNRASPPLHFRLNIREPGSRMLVCHPPPPWGKWDDGYGPYSAESVSFEVGGIAQRFFPVTALHYERFPEQFAGCVALHGRFPAGRTKLTVRATSETVILVSHIMFT